MGHILFVYHLIEHGTRVLYLHGHFKKSGLQNYPGTSCDSRWWTGWPKK